MQANLKGQYHNEIVATAEREIIEDTTVRLDYMHRWIGNDHRRRRRGPERQLHVRARQPGQRPGEAIDSTPDREATLDERRSGDGR